MLKSKINFNLYIIQQLQIWLNFLVCRYHNLYLGQKNKPVFVEEQLIKKEVNHHLHFQLQSFPKYFLKHNYNRGDMFTSNKFKN